MKLNAGGRGQGSIVNVASVVAYCPSPESITYDATKAAVVGMNHHNSIVNINAMAGRYDPQHGSRPRKVQH